MRSIGYTLSIPEPCHEDWNNMTENEHGRYCQACSKTVIDFSNKTEQEIAELLQKSQGEKMCGRFRNDQLNKSLVYSVNFDNLPGNMSVTKIFAIALLLVFGTGLVSCFDHRKHKINKIEWKTGSTNGEESSQGKKNPASNEYGKDVQFSELNKYVMGRSAIDLKTKSEKAEEFKTVEPGLAETAPSLSIDTLSIQTPMVFQTIGSISYTWGPPVVSHVASPPVTLGYVVAIENTEQWEAPFPAVEEDTVKQDIEDFEGLHLFPNPTIESFIVNYKLLEKSDVRIDVLDEEGKLIRNLLDVTGQEKGEYQVPGSAADLPRGIYFVSRLINGRRDLKKLVVGD